MDLIYKGNLSLEEQFQNYDTEYAFYGPEDLEQELSASKERAGEHFDPDAEYNQHLDAGNLVQATQILLGCRDPNSLPLAQQIVDEAILAAQGNNPNATLQEVMDQVSAILEEHDADSAR